MHVSVSQLLRSISLCVGSKFQNAYLVKVCPLLSFFFLIALVLRPRHLFAGSAARRIEKFRLVGELPVPIRDYLGVDQPVD